MKKTILLLLLGLALCAAFDTPAARAGEAPLPYAENPEARDLLPALRDEEPVYSVTDGRMMTLSQVTGEFTDALLPYERVAFVDLDSDGLLEAVLAFPLFENDSGYLALDRLDGRVTAYELVSRAMIDLKADGTFSFSSGAMDHGFGLLAFDGTAQRIVPVTWSEPGPGDTILYFMDGSPADEMDFLHALGVQAAVPGALWESFRPEDGAP